MKKSFLIKISTLALSVCSLLCIGTACKEEHTHSYTETVTAPTCTEQGFTTHTCSCGDSYVDTYVDALGHNFVDYVSNNDATCVENGTETATCSRENCNESNTRTDENSALDHEYGQVAYTWNGNQCTATRICGRDSTHQETEIVIAAYIKDTEATCTTAETGHYIATFVNSAFTTQATNEDTVVNGEPLTHNYSVPTYVWNGYECTATRICGRDSTHQETETVKAVYVKDTDVTCDTPETGHYKATFNNNAFVMQETEENSFIKGEALDHSFDEPTYTWVNDKCTAKRICSRDNSHVETETITATYVKDTNATCTTPEKGHYIAMFENVAFTTQTTADNTAENGEELGHSFINYTYNNNATCTENGTETAICSRDNCDEPHTRAKENTALGHDWKKDGNPVVNCTLSGGTQSYKCGRCTATKNEAVTTVSSGTPDMHSNLSVGEVCQYCGKEVLAKNGSSLVMKIDDTNYQVEHYEGKAVGFSKYKDYIKSAYISDSVTEIGNDAFYNYSALTSVEIPNSVTSIGEYAFYNCSSLNYTIEDNCKYLGNSTNSYLCLVGVMSTDITCVVVNENCKVIGDVAFRECTSLTSVTIGNSVTSIGSYAFRRCTSLTSIEIPDSVMRIGNDAFSGCTSLKSVTIGNSVTSIGRYAFWYCSSLTSVVISDSVTSIGYQAFDNCSSLTSVTIGDSVTTIEGSVFSGCYRLVEVINKSSSITVEKGATSNGYVGKYALAVYNSGDTFTGTKLSNDNGYIIYTDGEEKILVGCIGEETALTLPNFITQIHQYSFYDCDSLTSITIPDSVTSIGYRAFFGCTSLTSIDIPNSVTSIGEYAFYNCSSLTSITIPDSVTSIGYQAFYNCSSLTSVEIPDSVTTIGSSAFWYCSSLTSVVIPDSVTSIGYRAFYGCSSLTKIVLPFIGSTKDGTTNTHFGYIFGAYEYDYNYDYVPTSLKKVTVTGGDIEGHAFAYCSGLTNVEIPDSVTSIGESSFAYCYSLTRIEIPDSVTSIGSYAFYGCSGLTEIVIPNSVIEIGASAFRGCSSLTKVIFDKNIQLKNIDDCMFSGCSSLMDIVIPDSVKSIGNSAFYQCESLTEIVIPHSVTRISHYAFSECKSLTSVVIGDSVTSIGDWAFSGCSSLTSITIPDSVTSIGDWAFYNCSSLTSVYYKGTASAWSKISIASYNGGLTSATCYYYSKTEPTTTGNYWHYDENGNIAVW